MFLDQTRTQGNADITTGYNTATGAVNAGRTGALGALGTSYGDALGFANQGAGGAIDYINQGSTGALGRLDQAGAAFDPLSALGTKYGAGTNLYLDSLGVNGADGNARASAAFTPSMAYNFNLDQGLEAINRARNARGMANSGNTDRDAQQFGAGLASREFSGWQDRLGGLVSPELQATSGAATGRAGIDVNAANLINSAGTARAGLESGRGSMLADLASRYGTNVAGIETGAGNTLANLATNAAGQRVGLSTNLASPYANTYGQEAAAQMQGSANLWSLGLSAAKLAAGGFGGGGGGMTMAPSPNGPNTFSPMAPKNSSWLSSLFG